MTQPPSVDPAAFAGLEGQVRALQPRLAQVEQRSAPDLKPLDARIAAVEGRPAPPAPDVKGPVAAAVAPLAQRLDAMTKDDQAAQAALAAKVEAAVAQAQAAAAGAQTGAQALAARMDALEKKLAEADQRATQQAAQSVRALRAQQALTTLESGKPLGEIPGAPPAAAKFAYAKPPTEPELRLSFVPAAAKAADASRPAGQDLSLGQRMLQHAETLVTIRQGDKVVVGTNAAQVLGAAKEKLDAGDLAGAVSALDALDPSAAQAMAGWRAQAQSLLDARAALTAMTVAASR